MGMMSKSSDGFLGLERDDHVQAAGVSTSEAEAQSKAKADDDRWPPGFRFHPTDEELVLYYLKRKICRGRLKLNMIGDIDVYKCEPWELPGKSLLQTGDKQWFFFSPRDRKYPNGVRSNRGTKCGYWKTTGKDRNISRNTRTVGMKKTLVFYKGRAPKGERTNWVMHEYTISKEELKVCNTVQDSYALYKIYQKSGPGPKNGEQYGAPFREEEWLDDDPFDDSLGNQSSGDNLFPLPEHADGFYKDLSVDSVNEILRQMAHDSPVTQHHINNMSYVSEVDGIGGMQSSVVGSLHGEVISAGTSEIWQLHEPVDDAQTGLELAKSMSSFVQPFEVPEAISFPHVADGDFMELNDLMDPQSGVSSLRSSSKKYPLLDRDGLCDFDFYFDAPMYLPEEVIPLEESALQPYFDSFSVDVADQSDHHLPESFDDENQYLATNFTSQLWTHEHKFSVSSSAEAGQVVLAPSASGIMHDRDSGNLIDVNEGIHKQGSCMGNPSEPWFTSAINSLLESVPTNPASASENTLISRAFERMSSFGAVRIGTRETGVAADVGTVTRREGRNSFLFLSCLGALWAILWVLMIGTMVKVFKALFGRFVAS